MLQTEENQQPQESSQGSTSLVINEIFYSIQGEAGHAGLPCIFVRTTTCQMRCTYCDTEYAFYEGRRQAVSEILTQIKSYPCRRVEITGGEPLLQKKPVISLMETLLERGYEVLLETGGGVSLDGVPDACVKIVDVKCPDSGELAHMNWSFLEKNVPLTQLKFVLSSESDYLWAKNWIDENAARIRDYPLYFSPVTDRFPAKRVAELILRDGLNVRLQLQLHKFIWGPDVRGV